MQELGWAEIEADDLSIWSKSQFTTFHRNVGYEVHLGMQIYPSWA